ncbi:retrovirus-related pol polyprotein from transposon TNT 1-94 [Tanacetum coccineum]|uniref:Retrovirus-related pol polyprotein from transposon TNT 1-94 n=1 Tax=Tanacetum coccineum TaxID=301880 RepID=A0ABQ4WQQ0_9ASTR
MKMRTLLSQQGYLSALQGRDKLPERLSDEEKDELMEKAHGAIILNLADSVLREVAGETTLAGLWLQLENLNNIEVRIEDEDRALILLCSLPKSYEHLVTTLLYGRETISMEDVKSALNSSELRKKVPADYVEESANGLMVRGRRNDKASSSRGRSRSKTRSKKFKCYNCHLEGHMRRDCPDLKGKRVATGADKVTAVAEGDSNGANVLSVTDDRYGDEWILDSGCTIQINMFDGTVRTLTDVRHVPELKKNLISLGTLDSIGCDYRGRGGVLKVSKGALVCDERLKD